MGRQALCYARSLAAVAENVAALEADLTTAFEDHPDAVIIKSFPGTWFGFGCQATWRDGRRPWTFRDGSRSEGIRRHCACHPGQRDESSITMRVVRNKRLNNAAYLWALPLILHSTHARAHYDRRRGNRRRTYRRVTEPGQSAYGDAPPLPRDSSALRRREGLRACQPFGAGFRRFLTHWAHAMSAGCSPSTTCQIAPSSYYAHRRRPVTDALRAEAVLVNVVIDLHRKNRDVYGIRKMWHAMTQAGHQVGRDQVARLMAIAGVQGVSRGPAHHHDDPPRQR